MFITFPAVLCIALPSSHMLEGFQGAVCIGKLPFFFPWSEGKAVSLNGLNDLSPLLIHDNSSIFRKSLGKRLLALFRLAVSYLPYLCLSVTSSFSSLCAWVCINCYVPEISPSIRLQSRHWWRQRDLLPLPVLPVYTNHALKAGASGIMSEKWRAERISVPHWGEQYSKVILRLLQWACRAGLTAQPPNH